MIGNVEADARACSVAWRRPHRRGHRTLTEAAFRSRPSSAAAHIFAALPARMWSKPGSISRHPGCPPAYWRYWVGIDPSYRDVTLTPGVDLATLMVLDVAALRLAIEAAEKRRPGRQHAQCAGGASARAALALVSTRLQDVLRNRGLLNARVGSCCPAPAMPPRTIRSFSAACLTVCSRTRRRQRASATRTASRALGLEGRRQRDTGRRFVSSISRRFALAGKRIALASYRPKQSTRRAARAGSGNAGQLRGVAGSVARLLIRLRAELWLDDVR